MRYLLSILLAIFASSCFGQLITEELEREINRRIELEINPSFSIGILYPDGTAEYYGYGQPNTYSKQPDSLTLYEIGSITKTFTSTLATFYLKDSLNAPLSHFFPEITHPKLAQISPYQLQHHIAGIPRLSEQLKDYKNARIAYETALSLNLKNELLKTKIERCKSLEAK
ncbi:beta-lactamase class C [Lishizhenia tianjinensis]|uniref:Beta-lactamase class C n=1 Tax=Lishizhenia tianjinensis TaxID=477690 RepID=A0A1I7B254_9FLAO|nr:serine hydrolase [Lishizhenia tianjinensis]SFT81184.1 beta-lactamase class C [Lishizhenia tianjinensis]